MSGVLCFGEALIDLCATGDNNYHRFPGGAPANVAVAVAALGGKSRFAGQVGKDFFGDYLVDSIKQYGVDTCFLSQHDSAKTALAFVDIDKSGDRSFSFYRQNSADILMQPEQVVASWFDDITIFHFCSNTMTTANMVSVTDKAVNMATSKGCLVSLDVNLRHNLWPELKVDRDIVNSFVGLAHIIKFSAEELDYLSAGDPNYLHSLLTTGVRLIVVTDGPEVIRYYTPKLEQRIFPPKVKAADTTAAGDAFVGGLLFSLCAQSHPTLTLESAESLLKVIQFASCCGAIAVTKPGAFPALPSLSEVESLITQVGFTI